MKKKLTKTKEKLKKNQIKDLSRQKTNQKSWPRGLTCRVSVVDDVIAVTDDVKSDVTVDVIARDSADDVVDEAAPTQNNGIDIAFGRETRVKRITMRLRRRMMSGGRRRRMSG